MGSRAAISCLCVYPIADTRFRSAAESAFSTLEERSTGDPALLAAITALLQPNYPLATVQPRASMGSRHPVHTWDAFRDGTVLDDELLQRARAGGADAAGQLYDRHHVLAYGLAMRTAHDAAAGAEAVIEAFQALLTHDDGHLTVRVRVARGARDAALASRARAKARADGGHDDALTGRQRTVVDLAHTHRLLGAEIASVLRLDIGDVRRLANEGLAALASGRSEAVLREAGRP